MSSMTGSNNKVFLGEYHVGDNMSMHVTVFVHGCTGEIIKTDSFKLENFALPGASVPLQVKSQLSTLHYPLPFLGPLLLSFSEFHFLQFVQVLGPSS